MADQLVVSENALGYLNQTRPWVKFLAIVGFVFIVLMVLVSFFFMFGRIPTAPGQQPMPAAFGGIFGFFYLLLSALYVMPCLFLYRYSKAISSIPSAGQAGLEEALKNQKSFWKFMGIMMAVVLCIYAFFLVIGILIAVVGIATHH